MTASGRRGYGAVVRRRLVVIDVVLAAVAFAISLAVVHHDDASAADLRSADVFAVALLALYSGSVVLRRFAPVAAVAVGLVSGCAYAIAGYPVALTPVVLFAIYTAAAELPPRSARHVLVAVVVAALVGATSSPGPTDPGVLALAVSAWLLGKYVGSRRDHARELERQNRLLQEARLELADRAVGEERLRIARELHDVVAHTLTVVALHAGTGRMVADVDPTAARDALGTIETATRSALLEMRRMLGVLREPDQHRSTGLAPTPGLTDLDDLVAEVVRSGVTVAVRIDGVRRNVPVGVDLSAYRIIQEALTNVIKHSAGARTTVVVRYEEDAVTVCVDDDGIRAGVGDHPRDHVLHDATGGGHGLVGMRERVALYDGDFAAGPTAGGGFSVRARLPYAGHAS